MPNVSRLQLDVLKPHKPNAYDFTVALSTVDPTWSFSLDVVEIDEQTESICLRHFTGKTYRVRGNCS
jgi:hypothetical protein